MDEQWNEPGKWTDWKGNEMKRRGDLPPGAIERWATALDLQPSPLPDDLAPQPLATTETIACQQGRPHSTAFIPLRRWASRLIRGMAGPKGVKPQPLTQFSGKFQFRNRLSGCQAADHSTCIRTARVDFPRTERTTSTGPRNPGGICRLSWSSPAKVPCGPA